ncbi:ORF394 [White spot syndrome virus]|uniref:ORF394 n=1 Tax=White spot syndrome virus TaxID=342409 RepID=A0A2D3I569_9VIRU|nr:ORF394 [White spot syndrome virus]
MKDGERHDCVKLDGVNASQIPDNVLCFWFHAFNTILLAHGFLGKKKLHCQKRRVVNVTQKETVFSLEETHNLVKLIIVIDDAIIDIGSKGRDLFRGWRRLVDVVLVSRTAARFPSRSSFLIIFFLVVSISRIVQSFTRHLLL